MVSEPARVADRLRLVITVVAVSLCACSDEKASAPQAPSSPAAVLARAEDLSARHRVVEALEAIEAYVSSRASSASVTGQVDYAKAALRSDLDLFDAAGRHS